MYDITVKQVSNGLIIDRVSFSLEPHYNSVLYEIVTKHGLRRKSHTPTEQRFTNGKVLVIGRKDSRTPTQRIIDAADKAVRRI